MAYTGHGWHIKGTVLEDRPEGLLTDRCGGVALCGSCSKDAAAALEHEKVSKPQKVYYTKATVDKLYEVLNKSEVLDLNQTYRVIDALQESGVVTEVRETHDQDTMSKVYSSLARAGLTHQQLLDVVNDMQNQGILFRERLKKP